MTEGPKPALDAAANLEGRALDGRYRVVRRMGAGGMGAVYEGEHVALGTRVAIKVLQSNLAAQEKYRQRFLREARAASAIRSDNVVQISDFGMTSDGVVYIVMEFLEGRDLEQVLRATGPMPWSRAHGLLCKILGALRAAHSKNIIHRDIKAANCFVFDNPDKGIVDDLKVLDFGLAKVTVDDDPAARGLTGTGEMFGTVSYMAPELVQNKPADARTDLYAFGVLMYRTLVGELPFQAPNAYLVLTQQLNELPPHPQQKNPDIPERVATTILRALAKDPAQRYQSADEMLSELLAIPAHARGEGQTSIAPAPTAPPGHRPAAPAPAAAPRRGTAGAPPRGRPRAAASKGRPSPAPPAAAGAPKGRPSPAPPAAAGAPKGRPSPAPPRAAEASPPGRPRSAGASPKAEPFAAAPAPAGRPRAALLGVGDIPMPSASAKAAGPGAPPVASPPPSTGPAAAQSAPAAPVAASPGVTAPSVDMTPPGAGSPSTPASSGQQWPRSSGPYETVAPPAAHASASASASMSATAGASASGSDDAAASMQSVSGSGDVGDTMVAIGSELGPAHVQTTPSLEIETRDGPPLRAIALGLGAAALLAGVGLAVAMSMRGDDPAPPSVAKAAPADAASVTPTPPSPAIEDPPSADDGVQPEPEDSSAVQLEPEPAPEPELVPVPVPEPEPEPPASKPKPKPKPKPAVLTDGRAQRSIKRKAKSKCKGAGDVKITAHIKSTGDASNLSSVSGGTKDGRACVKTIVMATKFPAEASRMLKFSLTL